MQTIQLFKPADATHTVAAGQYIFQAGDPSDCAYVLLAGQAEVVIHDQVVEEAGAGTLLGEMALVERRERSASVRAVTDCQLLALDERRFLFLIQQHPFFALQVMQIMAERLRRMSQLLARPA